MTRSGCGGPVSAPRVPRRGATVGVHAALVPLWRGLVVFRVVALAYAVVNVVRGADGYARPALGVAVVVFLALWTLARAWPTCAARGTSPSSTSGPR